MSIVPAHLVRTALALRGPAGEEWAQRLPSLVAACARRWSLQVEPPFPDLSYNFAAPASRADGTGLVLKICFPDREFFTEADALRLFAGRGAVQLLEVDLDVGAMLLERIEPGRSLVTIDDEAATSAAASVMCRLWRPVPAGHRFPAVADWAAGFARLRTRFDGGTGPLPARLVEEAERLFDDLLASSAPPVLLHGDLHHGNVLAARREPWLAIDPKGIIGEPAFDTAALLHNPENLLAAPHPGRILARRVDQLAEQLGFDRTRIRGWGLAQAVLAAYWSLEDVGRVWEQPLLCAQYLGEMDS
ncbi:MAG: aminoglycoside phosphotransferase family protein [Chloroflexota bacterium]|nr:aminoglycoside phosphotransferase family protein [Chloroflexota bacterium]